MRGGLLAGLAIHHGELDNNWVFDDGVRQKFEYQSDMTALSPYLSWELPGATRGLTVEGRAWALDGISEDSKDNQQWSISATLRLTRPDWRGLSFALTSGYGSSAGDIHTIWRNGWWTRAIDRNPNAWFHARITYNLTPHPVWTTCPRLEQGADTWRLNAPRKRFPVLEPAMWLGGICGAGCRHSSTKTPAKPISRGNELKFEFPRIIRY